MENKRSAVIFDLDGTLWDATASSCDIWNRVFEKHGETNLHMTPEISKGLMGKAQNIRRLMARNGIGSACFVGDTDDDEKAARTAGIPFIWAAYGFGQAQAPDAVMHSITELPGLLETIPACRGEII